MKFILRNTPNHGDLSVEFFEKYPEWKPDMDDFLRGFASIQSLYTGLIHHNTIYPQKINILNIQCPNCNFVRIKYI